MQQYPPQQILQYDGTAGFAQPPKATNDVTAQLTNIVALLMQDRADVAGMRGMAANPANGALGPTLKPGGVATLEPTSLSDSDAASRFIDYIRDAIAHYGELRTRAVLRRYLKGPVVEDWIVGVSNDDREALRLDARHWMRMVKRDFMPYLASRLTAAHVETFRWNQGRTPPECVTKKLC